jgi:lipopolysaccharide/colanic/teichoic acid biosynthesis glycosyltransferase
VSAVGERSAGFPVPAPAALSAPPPQPGYLVLKRALDIAVATLLLVVLFPLMAVIAIAITVDTPGPFLFRQERVGARLRRRAGTWRWELQTFRKVKFRTMVDGADRSDLHVAFVEAYVAGRLEEEPAAAPYKLDADPRVTRVGRALRATSLDELPQLLNVIAGSMSLVGPRPVPVYEVAHYQEHHLRRLAGRPGLTGPWQVHGRGTTTFEEMVDLDTGYLHAQSLWIDLKLIARTIPCVLRRKGAR